MCHFLLTHRYTVLYPVWCRIYRYTPVPLSASKRVCMLFWSSSASSCSFSHMAACASASSESSFSSSVRLWLFMNFAMLSAVCCCLFIFLLSPFCLSSA
uniref:Plasmid mobilization protein, N-terminal part n=1 Tax=Escherichia coli O119:H6 TaxID=397448 RepID=A0A140JYY2_ECOLX|nr:plasmid mobilization protein, N-terminal part [Escherichia coli O119:H6]